MKKIIVNGLLCSCLVSFPAIAADEQADVEKLDKVVVEGDSESVKKVIKQELAEISGGSSLFDLNDTPTTKSTLNDVLGNEVGVIMQPFFGANDQPRISVRGSGIQDNPVNRGVQLLYDGLPINQPDGSFVIGLVAPEQMRFVTVYRGANAQEFGGSTLGGAINFSARTGKTSENFVRLQRGSFKTVEGSFGFGGLSETFDYFIAGGVSSTDGYRNWSESERNNMMANFGFAIGDNVRNRTWINHVDNSFNIPFVVQKEMALSSPESIIGDGLAGGFSYPSSLPMPAVLHPRFGWNARGGWDGIFNVYNRKPHRDSEQLRVANRTTIEQGSATHKVGFYGEKLEDTFVDPLSHTVTDSENWGFNYTLDKALDKGRYLLTANYNIGEMPREYWVNSAVDGSKVYKYGDLDLDATNLVLGFEYQLDLSETIDLDFAIQYIKSSRDIAGVGSVFGSPNMAELAKKSDYDGFNPKIGITFLLNDELRLFSNVSKSFETPTFGHLVSTSVGALAMPGTVLNPPQVPPFAVPEIVSGVTLKDLSEQAATTFEIGLQADYETTSWEASYYYSKVEDELITLVTDYAVNAETLNYSDDTIHQGLELGFNQVFAKGVFNDNDYFAIKFAYNYSHFTFDGGIFDGNQIAGIPEHLGFTELAYHFGEKFFIAPNVRWQPSSTYVDHYNTQKQDSFTLFGLKALYQPSYSLKFFLDAQNLTDEVYQTSYVIRGISEVNQPTFLPGFGTNVKLGVEYSW